MSSKFLCAHGFLFCFNNENKKFSIENTNAPKINKISTDQCKCSLCGECIYILTFHSVIPEVSNLESIYTDKSSVFIYNNLIFSVFTRINFRVCCKVHRYMNNITLTAILFRIKEHFLL